MARLSSIAAVVLAAGRGTRMQSAMPKVLHPLAQQPLLAHVLQQLQPLNCEKIAVVVAPGDDAVATLVAPHPVVVQKQPRGTGDALRAAEPLLRGQCGQILMVYGDTPLISSTTLRRVMDRLKEADRPAVVVLGMTLDNPTNFGRLIKDEKGNLTAIVEERDASPEQRVIKHCYAGVMGFDADYLWDLLARIDNKNAKGEYYLTDIVALARARGLACVSVDAPADELIGINTRAELAAVEAILQDRLRRRWMAAGVTFLDPASVYLAMDTVIGRDCVIEPNVYFGPGVQVGENVRIRAFSHLEGAIVHTGAEIGPFARLRPGTIIGEGARIGNFVEVKNSHIMAGAKANHLSYLGDATVDEKANIGAGTITCNYDGIAKHSTRIGAGAFIGSNTALVAPVTIGDRAMIGAGSVITGDVPADALAIARGRQKNRPGLAARWRDKRKRNQES